MGEEIQGEAIGVWARKSELERALLGGIHGAPELKRDERIHYLGEFKERIIKLLTKRQVAEPVIYSEIVKALQDRNATKMVISGAVDSRLANKYRKLAAKMKKPCTTIHDPELKGEAGLIVVGREATGAANIEVEPRKKRLKKLGLPGKLIDAAGKKICRKCYQKILRSAPKEALNYSELSWADRLLGEHCTAHHED